MVQFFKPQSGKTAPQRLTLTIDRLDDQGRGVGRYQGKVVFVEGALPGEKVEARVSRSAARYLEAKVVTILNASDQRLAPPCPHFGRCGGCRLQHASLELQHQAKQQQLLHQLKQLGGSEPVTLAAKVSGEGYRYRRRARLALRFERGVLQLGFRAAASSDICDIEQCPVLQPELEQWLPKIRSALAEFARPDDFGHAELLLSDEGPLLLLRRLRLPPEPRRQGLAQALAGLRLCYEENDGSVVDHDGQAVAASHYQLTTPQPLAVAFQPNHFVQVNSAVNQALVAQVVDWLAVAPGERIADLFCGVGNFSLPLAAAGGQVWGVEGVAAMVAQARANAAELGLSAQFLLGDLNEGIPPALAAQGPFAKVVLDPSREGARTIASQLLQLGAQRVVYVSCNPATLARDSAALVAQGFVMSRVALVDMFPQTHHLEAMALFERC